MTIRSTLLAAIIALSACVATTGSVGIGVNLGFTLQSYPDMELVPGYPVYYTPYMDSNYFFYDGLYWQFYNDGWYFSTWYNGPWDFCAPGYVPYYVLQVPVRYYRKPPAYFGRWSGSESPHWDEHWGRDWKRTHPDWSRPQRGAIVPAPLPDYQRRYAGNRYPDRQQQATLSGQNYNYEPRENFTREKLHQFRERSGGGSVPMAPPPVAPPPVTPQPVAPPPFTPPPAAPPSIAPQSPPMRTGEGPRGRVDQTQQQRVGAPRPPERAKQPQPVAPQPVAPQSPPVRTGDGQRGRVDQTQQQRVEAPRPPERAKQPQPVAPPSVTPPPVARPQVAPPLVAPQSPPVRTGEGPPGRVDQAQQQRVEAPRPPERAKQPIAPQPAAPPPVAPQSPPVRTGEEPPRQAGQAQQ